MCLPTYSLVSITYMYVRAHDYVCVHVSLIYEGNLILGKRFISNSILIWLIIKVYREKSTNLKKNEQKW